MKKTLISMVCVTLSLIAMTMPSVPLIFGLTNGIKVVYYPYFSSLPIGYAVWTPIFSLVLSIFALLFLFTMLSTKRSLERPISKCLILSISAHLIWWAFDLFRSVHPIGWVIVGLHLVALVLMNWDTLHKRWNRKQPDQTRSCGTTDLPEQGE